MHIFHKLRKKDSQKHKCNTHGRPYSKLQISSDSLTLAYNWRRPNVGFITYKVSQAFWWYPIMQVGLLDSSVNRTFREVFDLIWIEHVRRFLHYKKWICVGSYANHWCIQCFLVTTASHKHCFLFKWLGKNGWASDNVTKVSTFCHKRFFLLWWNPSVGRSN